MSDPDILRRRPDLAAIGQALEAHRQGRKPDLVCPDCAAGVSVVELPVGDLFVRCENDHTVARFRRRVS